jgi:hypothetical protein
MTGFMTAINANHTLGLVVGGLSSLGWTIAYVLILRQGARDRTFGMPLAALGANLSWELIFLVVTLKSGDYDARLGMLLPWTLLDFGILVQCFRHGRDDFAHPTIVRYFGIGLVGIIGLAFAILLSFVHEMRDAIGWYAAFGQNLMMSILFVAMFFRRGGARGQSVGIAVSKLLGTFFAFVLALCWSPPTLHEHWAALMPTGYTPIAPLLVTLYAGILAFDVLYLALLLGARPRR